MAEFSSTFKMKGVDDKDLAHMYTQALLIADKRNVERMDERIKGSQYDQLHHFVSVSPWDHRALMDQTARRAAKKLLMHSKTENLPIGFYIDESSFAKKGVMSVGVGRQWLGSKGKVDNGQVAVFSALGCGQHCALMDCRIYLPKDWTKDPERCDKANIPVDERQYKTKIELASESVEHLDDLGIKVDFHAVDALYGSSMEFMNGLEIHGKPVLGRVRSDFQFYLEKPEFYLPERTSNRGRKPSKMRTNRKAVSAVKLKQQSEEHEWQKIAVRDTDKGKLWLDIIHKKIWVRCKKTNETFERELLITRENEEGKVKYSYTLVISADCTDLQRLVQMDRQRYWIERSFQDAKNEAGLDEYQVRNYRGFHHHMSLSMLAYLFLMEQRMRLKDKIELLSCHDIRLCMQFLITGKVVTFDDLYRQMEIRHFKRKSSTESAIRRQKLKLV